MNQVGTLFPPSNKAMNEYFLRFDMVDSAELII